MTDRMPLRPRGSADYFSNRAVPGRFFATEVYDVVLNPLPARAGSGATVGGCGEHALRAAWSSSASADQITVSRGAE
jgi:hypothetical protein